MSDFYVEKENESSLTIYNKRVIYDFNSQNEGYSNLVDFNFGEKFLYGRVSRNFKPIYFNNNFIKLKTLPPIGASNTPPQAINFVVDMFQRLSLQFKKSVAIGKISSDHPFLSDLKVYKAFEDPVDLHNSFLQTQLSAFKQELSKTKYNNIQEFMTLFESLLNDSLKIYPITFAGFVKSRFCPISVSGLALEIADAEYFNDNNKIQEFIESPNWQFFLNACRSYGFMVDKLIPWRIVADIATTECLQYSSNYGYSSTNQILNIGYARTDITFFNKLKFYLVNLYNSNANVYAESYDCNGIPKTRYRSIPKITVDSFDQVISEKMLLNFYLKVRIMEEDKKLTEGEKLKLIKDCLSTYDVRGLSTALSRFETIINQPFDSPGSISYLNEGFKKRRQEDS